jgi:gamma-glutamyltranspeptidase / glutathione hydrolase
VAACCATGAGLHQRTIQALVNILDFGMTPQAAVNTPAFLQNNWSSSGTVAQFGEGTFDPNVLAGLKALGMRLNIFTSGENAPWGYWTGVRIDPETRRMRGGVTGIGQVSGY